MSDAEVQAAIVNAEMIRRKSASDGNGSDDSIILDPSDPLPSARALIEQRYQIGDHRTLHHHAGVFYEWSGACYPRADDAAIRAIVYAFLESALRPDGKPFQPTTLKVNNVLDALRAASNVPSTVAPPAWLEYTPDLPPHEIVACTNGLLHLPTRDLMPATPAFFSHNAVEFAFDPKAPSPGRWLTFLEELWNKDQEPKDTLQELFGYFLTSDTQQQKIAMIVGPKRSGKGTMARVLTKVLGQDNVCAPTLASLGQNFGLAPLIGKQLAIISDARLGSRADQQAIAERLLSVSGEDGITVDRKFLPAWTSKLPTRFLLLTNELPRLADSSGALASRFILLTLHESFYGREDPALTDKLLDELPGIFNWSLDGWDRLQERGYFVQPASSQEALQELEDLSSPVGAFVRECCIIAANERVACDILYSTWKTWCEEHGRKYPGTSQTFGRDLRAVMPGLRRSQRREDDDSRVGYYLGIGL